MCTQAVQTAGQMLDFSNPSFPVFVSMWALSNAGSAKLTDDKWFLKTDIQRNLPINQPIILEQGLLLVMPLQAVT